MSTGNTPLHTELAKNTTYIGECIFQGRLYHLGRYPALKIGKRSIKGELYKVNNPKILEMLDEYESTDNDNPRKPGFTRKAITLTKPKVKAWAYFYDGNVNEQDLIETDYWSN